MKRRTYRPLWKMRCIGSKEAITPYFAGALDVFAREGAEVLKSVFFTTHMGAGGLIEKKAFLACANQIIEDVRRAKGIDGVFLRLHGASDVEDLGQGELYILRGIREAIGYEIPIAVAMDPHGNLSPDIVKYANVIRSYHTAPHRDVPETCRVVAECLVECVNKQKLVKPAFVRIPMLLSGDFAIPTLNLPGSIRRKLPPTKRCQKFSALRFHLLCVRRRGSQLSLRSHCAFFHGALRQGAKRSPRDGGW